MNNKPKKASIPNHHKNGNFSNEWDKINQIKESTVRAAVAMTMHALDVSTAVRTVVTEHIREPLRNVTNEQLMILTKTATTLADDISKHQQSITEVGKSHEGKTGGVRSDDQLVEAMNVASNYHNLTNDTIDIASDTLGDLVVGLSQIVDDNKDRKIDNVVNGINKVKESIEANRLNAQTGE